MPGGEEAPRILGIVNVTEDSFSDGGRFLDPARAIEHALRLAGEGAWAIDVGAASSHPDARDVPPRQEMERLAPVLAALREAGLRTSVDAWHPETQRFALARDVDLLNDIQGFPDPAALPELAASRALLVVMHAVQGRGRATRVATDPGGILARIERFFEDRVEGLVSAGVARERIVLDPGMGFFLGRDPEPSLVVLRHLRRLRERFGLPLLVSVSRKSFLGALTGRETPDLASATLAAEIFASEEGADYLRTHDVAALRDALRVRSALR